MEESICAKWGGGYLGEFMRVLGDRGEYLEESMCALCDRGKYSGQPIHVLSESSVWPIPRLRDSGEYFRGAVGIRRLYPAVTTHGLL